MTLTRPILVSLAAVAAVAAPYLALGGGSFEPTPVADPCVAREWRDPGGVDEVLEQILLSGLDGAACELGVSREELVVAVGSQEALEELADEHGLSSDDAEQAVDDGLRRAIDDAEDAGALPGLLAALAREAADAVPPWLLLEAFDRLGGLVP